VLHMDALTVTGKTHKENIEGSCSCYNSDVIYKFNDPIIEEAGIVVVKGNLALNGAVIKPSAATPALMQHRGRAVVFENIEDYHARVDDPDLDIDETCVMVLKNVGPVGYPGMPEVGNMLLPKKLLDKGITDMVRISDGRMSGTAYGTVVLHVSPESAIGGNLALVKSGDMIELDVHNRRIHLEVSDEELAKRRKSWKQPEFVSTRGYVNLYVRHVQQADKGADLDFLVGKSGDKVTRDSH
jgi:L-arabonate dehydrase